MKFTLFGGYGFIGGHLRHYLSDLGHEVTAPRRGEEHDLIATDVNLGHVIYAIGITGDFRNRPIDTVNAHVTQLSKWLHKAKFESWLYLSSTRIYEAVETSVKAQEDMSIPVSPTGDMIYNLSKLLGEALCLSQESPFIRVARLSNVYGSPQNPHTFLGAILKDMKDNRCVVINDAPTSERDYISINDVVFYLTQIALNGTHRLYNVASGVQTSHQAIVDTLTHVSRCDFHFAKHGREKKSPLIDVSRIHQEFSSPQHHILDELVDLI